ncbi:chorismate mutase [Chlorobium sp. N1]|uniref:chorismate mutase n=1 Tax=Chlorobium sp. N1 TaxID=2491138 RepID=UPI00103F00BD|nr:chorismate mutase [Chlorobium sp. N1]TCD48189.1 chorismate mutase [Chlorobium sp. N1]
MTTDTPSGHEAEWQELERWRKRIDSIDRELTALLDERLDCAGRISALKSVMGEEVLQPEREKEVIHNVIERAGSEEKSRTLVNIYRSILEESRLFQHGCKNRAGSAPEA